jgi:protein arginine kinase activator
MKCEICGNANSVFHIQQILNGEQKSVYLCGDCARERNLDASALETFSLVQELWNGLSNGGDKEAQEVRPQLPALTCADCGHTTAELEEEGRLGCPSCYVLFADMIRPALQDVHKGTVHIGKEPVSGECSAAALVASPEQTREQELQRQLDDAVRAEKYEEAACLRDRLQELTENE